MGNSREVEIGERKLVVYEHENVSDPATGRAYTGSWIWDCSFVLAYWMGSNSWPPGSFKGKRVVELGAGTGIPGLAAAVLGADVVLTDIQALVPGLQRNVDENGLGEKAKVETLVWGDDCSMLSPPVDFILISDLLYDATAMPALCHTLKELSNENTEILVACEIRFGISDCLEMIKAEGFILSKVPQHHLHPDWQSQDYAVFILTVEGKSI
eukprot:Gb_17486 [translate_table: standard]